MKTLKRLENEDIELAIIEWLKSTNLVVKGVEIGWAGSINGGAYAMVEVEDSSL